MALFATAAKPLLTEIPRSPSAAAVTLDPRVSSIVIWHLPKADVSCWILQPDPKNENDFRTRVACTNGSKDVAETIDEVDSIRDDKILDRLSVRPGVPPLTTDLLQISGVAGANRASIVLFQPIWDETAGRYRFKRVLEESSRSAVWLDVDGDLTEDLILVDEVRFGLAGNPKIGLPYRYRVLIRSGAGLLQLGTFSGWPFNLKRIAKAAAARSAGR